jgi:hypothetical protein
LIGRATPATFRPNRAERQTQWRVGVRRRGAAIAAVAVGVLVFAAGFAVGRWVVARDDPRTLIGGGYIIEGGGQLWVRGTGYILQPSVAWRDAEGAEHAGGWPACLTQGDRQGVRFRGSVDSAQAGGKAWVLWVDCSGG